MNERPNILFINTDQHSWDAISAYGKSVSFGTPNIDELHRNGTSFRRSFCTDPVCAAARSSWATGLYTSETGVPFNGGYLHTQKSLTLDNCLTRVAIKHSTAASGMCRAEMVRESFQTLYYGQQDIGAGGAAYYDSASTHAVADFLTNYDSDDPFYLQIGYVDPHDVCEYLHNHEEKTYPKTRWSSESFPKTICRRSQKTSVMMNRKPCYTGSAEGLTTRLSTPRSQRGPEWDEFHWRYLRWNYYRFIEKVDAEIGRGPRAAARDISAP